MTSTLRVQTNRSGKYQRTYTIAGTLKVKTLSSGVVQDALISETHRGMLTDNHGQVSRPERPRPRLPTGGAARRYRQRGRDGQGLPRRGRTLLLVDQPDPSGKETGAYDIAVDTLQAGPGDTVLFMDEGNGARQILGLDPGAIRAVVVGVVDELTVDG